MIVHLTQDLMMTSYASEAARACDQKFKFVASVDRVIDLINENNVQLVAVDLQIDGLDLTKLESEFDRLQPEKRPPLVAYAQHVHVDLLEQANQSIFEKVYTRGQFHHGVKDIFSEAIAAQRK